MPIALEEQAPSIEDVVTSTPLENLLLIKKNTLKEEERPTTLAENDLLKEDDFDTSFLEEEDSKLVEEAESFLQENTKEILPIEEADKKEDDLEPLHTPKDLFEYEEQEEDAYAFEEHEDEIPQGSEPKEVKIIEGEKYIVKETKSSLFIREKDPIKEIDESEDEIPDIPYKRIDFNNR